ncbi:DUF6233 domain-containing protein [Streptomyces sp. NPDC040724]|uniref:DUF6233 domain-containing protein n=1 Tax=Streptomyces sp. NPDC040724 TaxID=3155612 RepID=UPI00340501AF
MFPSGRRPPGAGSSRLSTARGSPPSSCARCPVSTSIASPPTPVPVPRRRPGGRGCSTAASTDAPPPSTPKAAPAPPTAHPLGTMQALDALARPGTTACTVCDAAEALLPILAHGQDDVPAPGD